MAKAKKPNKKTPAKKKAAAKKSPAKKAVAKAANKKAPAKKAAAKKAAAKKAAAKKSAPSKKAASKAKAAPKKKAKAQKSPAKKASAPKAQPKKTPATKAAAKTVKKAAATKAAKGKTGAVRKPPKTTTGRKASVTKSAPVKRRKRAASDATSGPLHGVEPYQPKKGEEYMSDAQLEHFRLILNNWKVELMEEVDRTITHLKDEVSNFPDPNDRATQESEFGLELKARDRERKLLRKIDSALARIDDGSYGFCEETGDEIGLKRLEARPIATLCLEAQERHEMTERHFSDREDLFR